MIALPGSNKAASAVIGVCEDLWLSFRVKTLAVPIFKEMIECEGFSAAAEVLDSLDLHLCCVTPVVSSHGKVVTAGACDCGGGTANVISSGLMTSWGNAACCLVLLSFNHSQAVKCVLCVRKLSCLLG